MNWQTLVDQVAKFSIQYPPNYKVAEYSNGSGGYLLGCINDPNRGELCMSGFSIKIYNNYSGGSRREWLFAQYPNIKNFLINPVFKDLNVQNVNVLAVLDTNSGGSTGSWAIIPKGTQIILLTFPVGGDISSPGFKSIKQFLSTFKFTN